MDDLFERINGTVAELESTKAKVEQIKTEKLKFTGFMVEIINKLDKIISESVKDFQKHIDDIEEREKLLDEKLIDLTRDLISLERECRETF